ncbi:MAG: zinc-dependent metalloprotease [Thermoanaerobaculia bacterium]
MKLRFGIAFVFLACGLALPENAWAAPSISRVTEGMTRQDGYFPLYWDPAKGRLLVEIARLGEDFLYLPSLATGLGDVEVSIQLDRGTPGDESIARFERVGPKVHLVLQNPRFRAVTDNAALARSVEESFPTSTVASLEVIAEDPGRVLVDGTPFFLSDVLDVRGVFREARQGTFALDREKSRIHLARTKAFPENTEVEASLTFTSDQPGTRLRQNVPEPRALTLRQHHSLVRLPGPGFAARRFDPRIGVYAVRFFDFAKRFDEDYVTRHAVRHRLIKKDPSSARSEPVEPIVYYLDRGVPEPYRSAFKAGGMWWNDVFEKAGFIGAFRIEDMPPDMDPLDARYDVIQWFHRTQWSSSVGPSFVDPRTGEIIKAAVRMDSHRSLANYELYAAMLPALLESGPRPPNEAEQVLMARRRQHAAHEIGHTLGLAHNFAAAFDDRASVMAYPAPWVRLEGGRLDLSQAYAPGPGPYDHLAIRYAYSQFPPGQEETGLRAILEEAMAKGLRFITNPHEGEDSSFAEGSTWVNGADAVAELARVLPIRRLLVDRFDERAIKPGEPMAVLNRRLASAYLYHAPTISAAVKAVGGVEFRYAVRGDQIPPTKVVSPALQRRALELLLDSIEPAELAVPERVLAAIPPAPFGYERDESAFPSDAGTVLDQLAAARVLAGHVVGQLLAPTRAARLAVLAGRDPAQPGLEQVIARIIERTHDQTAARDHAAMRRAAERVVLDELFGLALHGRATPEARAGAQWGLRRISALMKTRAPSSRAEVAHRDQAVSDIARFFEHRQTPPRMERARAPRRISLGDEAEFCGARLGGR